MVANCATDECIRWPFGVNPTSGHGQLYVREMKRCTGAHRTAFRIAYGYWPENANHTCDVALCVNPRHLRDGSQLANLADMRERGRLENNSVDGRFVSLITEQSIPTPRQYHAGTSLYEWMREQIANYSGEGCLLWPFGVNSQGRGSVWYPDEQRCVQVHRLAFKLVHGRWPEPCALHRCDVARCFAPPHLFEGSQADNVADMIAKGRAVIFPTKEAI